MMALIFFILLGLTNPAYAADTNRNCAAPLSTQAIIASKNTIFRTLRLADHKQLLRIYAYEIATAKEFSAINFVLLTKIVVSSLPAEQDWNRIEWGITLKDNDQLVGNVQIYDRRPDGSAQIGYHIDPQFWGRGLATEALQALIQYLITTLKLKSIRAEVAYDNVASQRVLEKLQFDLQGAYYSQVHTSYKEPLLHYEYSPPFWKRYYWSKKP